MLVKYGDGRESLAFTFDCAGWSGSCLVLGHLSVAWLLRDIIPGERRALLSIQVSVGDCPWLGGVLSDNGHISGTACSSVCPFFVDHV